jgi:hypothetical protein
MPTLFQEGVAEEEGISFLAGRKQCLEPGVRQAACPGGHVVEQGSWYKEMSW